MFGTVAVDLWKLNASINPMNIATLFPYSIRQTIVGDFALEVNGAGQDRVDVFIDEREVERAFGTRRAKKYLGDDWAAVKSMALRTVAQRHTTRHPWAP